MIFLFYRPKREEIVAPVEEQVEEEQVDDEVNEKINPLIAAASEHITKEVQMEAVSFQKPEIDPMSRTLDDLRNKIKQLENKITNKPTHQGGLRNQRSEGQACRINIKVK